MRRSLSSSPMHKRMCTRESVTSWNSLLVLLAPAPNTPHLSIHLITKASLGKFRRKRPLCWLASILNTSQMHSLNLQSARSILSVLSSIAITVSSFSLYTTLPLTESLTYIVSNCSGASLHLIKLKLNIVLYLKLDTREVETVFLSSLLGILLRN